MEGRMTELQASTALETVLESDQIILLGSSVLVNEKRLPSLYCMPWPMGEVIRIETVDW